MDNGPARDLLVAISWMGAQLTGLFAIIHSPGPRTRLPEIPFLGF
jgi:hypothetical protein